MIILILGAGGMLGSEVFKSFRRSKHYSVKATVRNAAALKFFTAEEAAAIQTNVDVLDADALVSLLDIARPDVVINCVGMIKQQSSVKDPLVALPINALFPHRLARLCSLVGARLVHVSTDCVFSGSAGSYTEDDTPDATDLYGRSKLLGEVVEHGNAVTLRTSIIGRELSSSLSLVDWFLAQQGQVQGYTNAIFSGLPTCELARVMRDIVVPKPELHGLYHVSAQPISKLELLRLIASHYGKNIDIIPNSEVVIDRSLDSSRFTAATGYRAPVWPELIRSMHETDSRRKS